MILSGPAFSDQHLLPLLAWLSPLKFKKGGGLALQGAAVVRDLQIALSNTQGMKVTKQADTWQHQSIIDQSDEQSPTFSHLAQPSVSWYGCFYALFNYTQKKKEANLGWEIGVNKRPLHDLRLRQVIPNQVFADG